ncbi:hypothetical protein L1987_83430 [Smallanthus sonchifolius]|uniref:Uncharacterized protein n=1 Tax=Smallanthus sonchifolius TaxID=185202 RepID=A0ACB8YBZ9_9ASTR|nr:hypothetical protein L1987_83430 [Smallanthus sonchifolius]
MASCSRVDIENTSIAKTFISWKEKVASERSEFFLQLQNFQWILAVVGSVTINHLNMEFVIDPTFYGFYKQHVTSLGNGMWKRRCDVVAWLNAQIFYKPFNNGKMLIGGSEHIFQVIMDAGDFSALIDTEGAKESLIV